MNDDILTELSREREEYLAKIREIDEDIANLSAGHDARHTPVSAFDFVSEPGDFEWLVGGLIADGTVTMVAAEPRIGKTTLLVQMALCLAMGREFLGMRVPKAVKPLYVLAEGSRNAFRARFSTACQALDIRFKDCPWAIQPASMADFNLKSASVSRLFTAAAKSGTKIVFLDTLGYFHGGDENDNSEWKRNVMGPLRAFGTQLGLSFVLVHHYGKSNPLKSRWERGRGASAMFGDVDHWLGLEKPELTEAEKMLPEAERSRLENVRELYVEKNKYGLDNVALRLEFHRAFGTFSVEMR